MNRSSSDLACGEAHGGVMRWNHWTDNGHKSLSNALIACPADIDHRTSPIRAESWLVKNSQDELVVAKWSTTTSRWKPVDGTTVLVTNVAYRVSSNSTLHSKDIFFSYRDVLIGALLGYWRTLPAARWGEDPPPPICQTAAPILNPRAAFDIW